MQESGLNLRWTAVGVVDADIASARSVIEWGAELQNSVDYLIVHNHFQDGVASSWENPKLAADVTAFREAFSPVEIRMDARRPDLQRMMRTMNVTLGDVGERRTVVAELRAPDMTPPCKNIPFPRFQSVHGSEKGTSAMNNVPGVANDKSAWIRDLVYLAFPEGEARENGFSSIWSSSSRRWTRKIPNGCGTS